jgi:hypothetical protein
MAEANRSIPQIPTIRITTAAHVLAQFRARQAVKDQLRKQGLKVSHYAARDITAMACEYLSEHRSELLPPAIETIERWTLAGEFGKRAQRALSAKLNTSAQNGIADLAATSVVQNS